jgi:V-type H+-transporting ATPase subunit G
MLWSTDSAAFCPDVQTNHSSRRQHTSGNKKAEEDADKDTEKKLEEIQQIGKKTGPQVVDQLLKAVMDVRPQVPDRVSQPVA